MTGAGYSGTPLPRKLGVKEGHRVGVLGAPGGFRDLLQPLPAGVQYQEGLTSDEPYDVIVLFATEPATLDAELRRAADRMRPDGGLWVAWAKKSSPLAGQLTFDTVQRSGLALGMVDNKVCAVDDDWSGLRFVVRLRDRPASPSRRSRP